MITQSLNIVTPDIYVDELQFHHTQHLSIFLADIAPLYPNFDHWFKHTFIPGLHAQTRKIYVAHNSDALLGCALLKLTSDEAKICTFLVTEEARGLGIGLQLMKKSLAALDNREVLLTVSDERQGSLKPLLNHAGFSHQHSVHDHYRTGKAEHFYLRN